jgi:hypothetical protein
MVEFRFYPSKVFAVLDSSCELLLILGGKERHRSNIV